MKPVIAEKIDTSKALSYLYFAWMTQGLYPVKNYKFYQTIHATLTFIGANLVSSVVFVTQLFFVDNLKQLLNNLPMNVCINASALKFIVMLATRRELVGINKILAQLDKRPMNHDQRNYIKSSISLSRRIVLLVFFIYEGVDILAAVGAALSNRKQLLFDIWLPYDWQANTMRYWCTFSYQFLAQSILAFQSLINDMSGPIYLLVLNTHLKIVMNRIEDLYNNQSKTDAENYRDLVDCIEDHRLILKIFDVLQGTVSYTIFIQFVSTAIVLCMNALSYLLYPPTLTEMFMLLFFMISEIIQILPCCFYSNMFMSTSDRLVTAIYSSNWFDQTPRFKKTMIIFMQMTQKSKVIVAGKIIPVTLATFVSIMKMSYSLFTATNQIK